MNRNKAIRVKAIFTLILFALFATPRVAQAGLAASGGWSPFENISKTPTSSTFPTMTADASGHLHVFWVEDAGGATRAPVNNPDGTPVLDFRGKPYNMLTYQGNTLDYTRWDGLQWLQPVDIFTVDQGHIYFPSSTVDPKGILHLIWTQGSTQETQLMYSQAPVDQAERVSAWSSPVSLAAPIINYYYPISITSDSTGGLHIAYFQSGSLPGVYVINSFDKGQTWDSPILMYANASSAGVEDGSMPIRLMVDKKDRIHLTWSRYDSSGNGKAIYYAQSTDLGKTWTKPFEVAYWKPGYYETDWLSVGVTGDKIVLNWEGGVISYSNERVSDDGGKTWSEERRIFPSLAGENGWADLVTDSNDQLYQLVVKRISGVSVTVYGVWYSQLIDGQWDVPRIVGSENYDFYDNVNSIDLAGLQKLFNKTINGDGLRYQRSAILNGNELWVIVVNEHDGDIYASHVQLDSKRIDPKPYPAIEPGAAAGGAMPTATISPRPTATILPQLYEKKQSSPSASSIFLVSMVPVVLLIAGLLVFRVRFQKN